MAITPTGSPAWTRTAGISQYGGNVDKRNYMGIGPIDALTDWSAEEFCRMTADLAACARTAPFAVMRIECNDNAPTAAPTVHSVYMMTGVRTTSYAGDAAPSGFPSVARNSNGVFTITFSSSYTDEYGVAGAFSPRHAEAILCDTGLPGTAEPEVTGQTVKIRCWDWSGGVTPDRIVTVVVY